MAQGDAINFYKVGLANNGMIDLGPGFDQGGSGDHWVIHEIYISAASSILWTNGAQSITLMTTSGAKWFTNLFRHCTNSNRLRIQNTSGGAADFGYSGIQTK
jgi:hypothetical protein